MVILMAMVQRACAESYPHEGGGAEDPGATARIQREVRIGGGDAENASPEVLAAMTRLAACIWLDSALYG